MDFRENPDQPPCVDHDHNTGVVRGCLCRNCNGREGEIINRANRCKRDGTALDFLRNLLAYLELHQTAQTPYIHWTHEFDDEKRLKRNAAARKKRAAKKLANTNVKRRSTK